jgi:glutamate-1-semialdehyde 2,1-aminomutase
MIGLGQGLPGPRACPQLEEKLAFFFEKLEALARSQGLPLRVTRVGSMGSFFFTRETVKDFTTVQQASAEAYGQFFRAMRERGVYLAPLPPLKPCLSPWPIPRKIWR